jgi:hypothetical protein
MWKICFTLVLSIAALACDAADVRHPGVDPQHANWIREMKSAERGPFSRIRWFCKDGQILPFLDSDQARGNELLRELDAPLLKRAGTTVALDEVP